MSHLKDVLSMILFDPNLFLIYPPASQGSREAANLTERKNPCSPVYGVKELVCLSVCDKL